MAKTHRPHRQMLLLSTLERLAESELIYLGLMEK